MKTNTNSNKTENPMPVPAQFTPVAAQSEQPLNVQVVERLTDADKALLETAKLKLELANANAKAAIAQNESARLTHSNIVLQLAMRYHLVDGDLITEEGEIKRKANG